MVPNPTKNASSSEFRIFWKIKKTLAQITKFEALKLHKQKSRETQLKWRNLKRQA